MAQMLSAEANQLVIKTLENIKKAPCSFDMKVWARNKTCYLSPLEVIEQEISCGTSMCFAGWLVYTYGQLNDKEKSIEKMSFTYPCSMHQRSYSVTALNMLDVHMESDYQFMYIYSAPRRKNSKDAALRLTSVFADKSIKTVEELEARLLKYKLLTYETQQVSETSKMVTLS